ncbi:MULTISPECIES: GNAT family N-acetyltransferase [unclassified Streptomyces]|uniref:GNAT family N-acetyltransferase n=1 Tax=unclassified Streptomyces TaxID=2593676 RepID=UPI002E810D31|nr:GNAT family N-acetyltransferase [Streptomyces sp. NBC_00589]WTI37318.1 GNAT family N-acetyltransferase [Streptomyces sp. NBC_00775]WUB29005.1 GNAT family N-acetyltransferase [Streptomyces sp. NBC_00589]
MSGGAHYPGSQADVRAVADAAGLPDAGWDGLLGAEDFFQTSRWLAVQERNSGTTMDFLVQHREEKPVAALVAAWADDSVPWLLARPDAMLSRALEDGGPPEAAAVLAEVAQGDPASLLPSLVCGGRHLGRTRTLAGPDALPSDVEALVVRAEQLAAERGAASVCFPHVDVRDAGLVELLRTRGYRSHLSAHYAWLPIPPGGWDQFLAEMSKHRRRRVRLERRALAEAKVEVHLEPLTKALAPRLGELDCNLLRKYGNPASPEHSAGLLSWISEVMGDDAMVSVARKDGAIIGFGMVLRSRARGEEQWFGHRAGFDYDAQGKLPLYYDVLYYRVLEAAAREGVSVLHAGIGSVEAKLARGCLASEEHSFLLRLPRTGSGKETTTR